jgi:membrane protease subunit HflK
MANNESGNGRDPWKRDNGQPIDLDQVVKEWQRKFDRILGGGGASGGYALLVLLVIAWMLTGFYRVDESERGVVQRFGKHTDTTMPGLRWHLPFPVEKVDIVNTQQIVNYPFRTEMLTADEQYVYIDIVVQYRRTDPVNYSFEVEDPEITLHDVTESALRGVVGTSSLTDLIGARRQEIPTRTMAEVQETLNDYGKGVGLTVTSVNLKDIDYPRSVQEAVDDTQKARNDRDFFKLEAETYAKDIVPRARGQAQRVLQAAEGYRDRVIADAQGESARFEALLVEYQRAPKVTRDRLYIEAIEDVYSRTNKIILDSDGSGNLLYLPIDQIMKNSRNATSGTRPAEATMRSGANPNNALTDSARERETR